MLANNKKMSNSKDYKGFSHNSVINNNNLFIMFYYICMQMLCTQIENH